MDLLLCEIEILRAEIERLTTENRIHVATIGCLIEQARSAAVAYQVEIERLRAEIAQLEAVIDDQMGGLERE